MNETDQLKKISWLLVSANVWLAVLVALMCYLLWGWQL